MTKLIINKKSNSNHETWLINQLCKSTSVLFATPYLSEKLIEYLRYCRPNKLKEFILITRFKTMEADHEIKLSTITALKELAKERKFIFQIYVDDKLHGKVYIVQREDSEYHGLITSANCTPNGLTHNHEYGVVIRDSKHLKRVKSQLLKDAERLHLNTSDIQKMTLMACHFKKTHPPRNQSEVFDLSGIIRANTKSHKVRYWLKPVGRSGHPIDQDDKYDQAVRILHFARHPKSVQKGDVLIINAVTWGKIVGLFRVLSHKPMYASLNKQNSNPNAKRWPWSIKGSNLSPTYGSKWGKSGLKLKDLKSEYQSGELTKVITSGHKPHYGALNHGADKLQITEEFAKFIISRVRSLNR